MKIIPNFTNQTHTTCVFLVMYLCFCVYVLLFFFLCICISYLCIFMYLCFSICVFAFGDLWPDLLHCTCFDIQPTPLKFDQMICQISLRWYQISNILFCTHLTLCSKDRSALHKIVKIYLIRLLNLVFTLNIC